MCVSNPSPFDRCPTNPFGRLLDLVQTRLDGFVAILCYAMLCYAIVLFLLLLCYSMECPWSSIDISEYQGEWVCVCLDIHPDFMTPINYLHAYMYTESDGVGWVMCGNCQGVWQHTHSSPHLGGEGDAMCVYHVCK